LHGIANRNKEKEWTEEGIITQQRIVNNKILSQASKDIVNNLLGGRDSCWHHAAITHQVINPRHILNRKNRNLSH